MSENLHIYRNLHRWQKFYTAARSDGMDKFHLCSLVNQLHLKNLRNHLFWETEAIFYRPSHTKGLWKICKPFKYGFTFSKLTIAKKW